MAHLNLAKQTLSNPLKRLRYQRGLLIALTRHMAKLVNILYRSRQVATPSQNLELLAMGGKISLFFSRAVRVYVGPLRDSSGQTYTLTTLVANILESKHNVCESRCVR